MAAQWPVSEAAIPCLSPRYVCSGLWGKNRSRRWRRPMKLFSAAIPCYWRVITRRLSMEQGGCGESQSSAANKQPTKRHPPPTTTRHPILEVWHHLNGCYVAFSSKSSLGAVLLKSSQVSTDAYRLRARHSSVAPPHNCEISGDKQSKISSTQICSRLCSSNVGKTNGGGDSDRPRLSRLSSLPEDGGLLYNLGRLKSHPRRSLGPNHRLGLSAS